MNPPANKSPKKRPKPGRAESGKKEKEDKRDPAVVRAETFRVAAMRETVEAFVVAFILALLFRAFLAEAFVIPTGSMAPTLMGAHKDIDCDRCGISFRCGASVERKIPVTREVVVATICPNCRHTNPLDLAGQSNDATFNGDRILVSKFSYALKEPQRWDVIVFKYPGNPKQNYIKRLVGLPGEILSIRYGDVYTRPLDAESQTNEILRKPPDKLLAMRQLVYDTHHQSAALIQANYPSRWQPWRENATEPPSDSWGIHRSQEGMTATLDSGSSDAFQWLRYYHRWPSEQEWEKVDQGASLADTDPYSSRLITDFYAYNAYLKVMSDFVYDEPPASFRGSRLERILNGGYSKGDFKPQYDSGGSPRQFGMHLDYGSYGLASDGMHWVGDLIVEADVETSDDSQELMLELIEAGVKHRCRINLSDGTATLGIDNGQPQPFVEGESKTNGPTAKTSIRAGRRHHLRFSNCDDQLLLWVDEDLVQFDGPTTFDSRSFRSDRENRPHFQPAHPMDAAPAAIAVKGGSSTIHGLRIDRDKYYIATDRNANGLNDYDLGRLRQLNGGGVTSNEIQQLFTIPQLWEEFGWEARRTVQFELQENQFFPMGDNSPESLDARCWAGTKIPRNLPRGVNKEAYTWTDASYVPRDLLVGKALVVFWPHSWNSPIPFTPNVKRMKLIR